MDHFEQGVMGERLGRRCKVAAKREAPRAKSKAQRANSKEQTQGAKRRKRRKVRDRGIFAGNRTTKVLVTARDGHSMLSVGSVDHCYRHHKPTINEESKIMRMRIKTLLCSTAVFSAVSCFTIAFAETNALNKAQVGDRIRKVENGVDDFEKYLTTRGENAQNQAASAKSEGKREGRGGGAKSENKKAAKNQASQTKDDLQNAMDDLNRSTNRLRRKFDATANYLETKVQMEQVMDSARRVNQVVAKGKDGQATRLWTALRASINDLARAYNITPMGA